MYSTIISLLFGIAVGCALGFSETSSVGWSIALGVMAALAASILFSLYFRKLMARKMAEIQAVIQSGMDQVQKRAQVMQSRPTGNPQQMMQQLEAYQKKAINAGLDSLQTLEPLRGWVPLMGRQISTMQMQFHYQLKEYDKAEELLPKCLFMDQLNVAMKMALMYRAKKPVEDIRKQFDKYAARMKYNKSSLIYALMGWILLKSKRDDEAHKLMIEACKKNENPILNANRDALANNRPREYSNAGFGDQWYALYLEEPKMNIRRQAPPRRGFRPF